jgi:hypothetical protein
MKLAKLKFLILSTPLFFSEGFAQEAYEYRTIEKQDTSYSSTTRLIYRIYLENVEEPEEEKMKATAQAIWQGYADRVDQLTVLIIFGPIKDFSSGAYGIAEYEDSGLVSFRVNETPLTMAKLFADENGSEAVENLGDWIDPLQLLVGMAYSLDTDTPLMFESDPDEPVDAIQRSVKLPAQAIIQIVEVWKQDGAHWYKAVASIEGELQDYTGWINSTALVGQRLIKADPRQ